MIIAIIILSLVVGVFLFRLLLQGLTAFGHHVDAHQSIDFYSRVAPHTRTQNHKPEVASPTYGGNPGTVKVPKNKLRPGVYEEAERQVNARWAAPGKRASKAAAKAYDAMQRNPSKRNIRKFAAATDRVDGINEASSREKGLLAKTLTSSRVNPVNAKVSRGHGRVRPHSEHPKISRRDSKTRKAASSVVKTGWVKRNIIGDMNKKV